MRERTDTAKLPTTAGGFFRRHLGAYVGGTLVLAVFQLAMNRIDWLSKATIDRIVGDHPEEAWRPAVTILGMAAIAFVSRVASRWFIFNAGRDVEYETRCSSIGCTGSGRRSTDHVVRRDHEPPTGTWPRCASSSGSACSTSSTCSPSPAPSRCSHDP